MIATRASRCSAVVFLAVLLASACDSSKNGKSLSESADTALQAQPAATAKETDGAVPEWEAEARDSMLHGDTDRALIAIDRTLVNEPRNIKALLWRANVRIVRKEYQAAHSDLDAALAIAPSDASIYVVKGNAFLSEGAPKTGDATSAFERALELDKQKPDAWFGRGIVRSMQLRHSEAVDDFTQAIKLDSARPTYFFHRGQELHGLEQYERAVQDFSSAAALAPADPNNYVWRADSWMALGQADKSAADYSKAIELDPNEPANYESRANALAKIREFDRAALDVLAAIKLTPNDAGRDYNLSENASLTLENLRHGEEQVTAMLRDRPEMAEFCTRDDALWKWAVRQFSGEAVGEAIYWDAHSPASSDAEHQIPTANELGAIRIRPISKSDDFDKTSAFEKLWSSAVFELHNIRSKPTFLQIIDEARTGTISKEAFILKTWRTERKAEQGTRAFYAHLFLPFAKNSGLPSSDASYWRVDSIQPEDVALTDLDEYYVKYYSDYYEVLMAEAEQNDGSAIKAKSRLREFLTNATAVEGEVLGRAYFSLGMCELHSGEDEAALESFKNAVAADSRWASEFLIPWIPPTRQLRVKGVRGETAQASGAFFVRGSAWDSQGDHEKAISDLTRSLELDPTFVAALIRRAAVYYNAGRADASIADFSKALALHPNHPQVIHFRGQVYAMKGQKDKAIADMNHFVTLSSNNSEALCARSQLHEQFGDIANAMLDVDAAISARPNVAAAYVQRGRLKHNQGDYKASVMDLDRAIHIDPNHSEAFGWRASARVAQNDFAGALLDLNELVRRDARNVVALCSRSLVHRELGDFQRALADANAAIEADSSYFGGYAARADVLREKGEFKVALLDYNRAVENAKESPQPYAARAAFLSECTEPDTRHIPHAIDDASHACELTQWQVPFYLATLAACYAESGDFTKAIEWQTKALELAHGEVKSEVERGLSAFRSGKTLREANKDIGPSDSNSQAIPASQPDDVRPVPTNGTCFPTPRAPSATALAA